MIHTRHMELFDVSNVSITLIGAGGIGATTALALAKMGVRFLNVYDGDTVDDVNLATQLHRLSDVGRPKVAALADVIAEFSDDTDVWDHMERVDHTTTLASQFIISAVDSITARKEIWQTVKYSKVRWYMDARMAAEEMHLFTVSMDDYGWYDQMLAGESETGVADVPCTMKATFYCALIAGGLIGSAVKNIVVGEWQPKIQIFNMRKHVLTVIP